jgi:flagellar hook-basal body complex protein FliE
MPVDPTMLTRGADWSIGTVEPAVDAPAKDGKGFGSMLGDKLGELTKLQDDATQGAQALASGTASDPTAVVMAVEKARLSMQLASQIRTKAVEAVNEVFRTSV